MTRPNSLSLEEVVPYEEDMQLHSPESIFASNPNMNISLYDSNTSQQEEGVTTMEVNLVVVVVVVGNDEALADELD